MSDTKTPSFRRGGDAAEEAAKSGGNFSRDTFFALEDGEGVYVRFVTDEPDWISVDQYSFLPTKPAPAGWKGNWPKHMSAVSRSDEAFTGMFADDYAKEFMRDREGKPFKPSSRTWAYVCLREEVKEDGRIVGFRDKTREISYEKDGKTVTEVVKDIRIVNLGWKNFFAPIKGYAKHYGTLLDRDIYIKRKGSGQNDTTYETVPMDPTPSWDLRNPEVAAQYKPERPLEEVVTERASDDYYRRFFDHRFTVEIDDKGGERAAEAPGAPVAQQTRPATDVDQSRVASLADRVMNYAAPATAPAEAAPGGLQNFS